MSIHEEKIRQINQEAPLTDVHAHPSVKAFIFRRNLWRHYCSGKTLNPMASRSDFKSLKKGDVGVIWASHFLPQRGFFKDCIWIRLSAKLFLPGYSRLVKGPFMPHLLKMMDRFEREVNRKPGLIEVAGSAADVTRISDSGKIAVVHTVEGAHVLDGDIGNLDILAQRGVALLTLSHFYPNDVASHVHAMPKNMFIRKICKFNFQTEGDPPLTDFGKEVLKKMSQLNMIVDLAHCSPKARAAIYGELASDRPVVATHMGVTKYHPHPYNLDDDDIREISNRGGAVGIMFMSSTLDQTNPKKGLPAIWKTIEHIHKVADSWDHIMLGTDFDGFTDPPDDVYKASQLGKVTGMLLEQGVEEANVKKIIGQNAQRVLKKGWQ